MAKSKQRQHGLVEYGLALFSVFSQMRAFGSGDLTTTVFCTFGEFHGANDDVLHSGIASFFLGRAETLLFNTMKLPGLDQSFDLFAVVFVHFSTRLSKVLDILVIET
jgi:hypothetical protein